jgi:hypothetical protein
MATEIDIDVGLLKSEIKKTYGRVSQNRETDFIFPTGRAWAEDLDYPAELEQEAIQGDADRIKNSGRVEPLFVPRASGGIRW